jgi:hypothetical protein
MEYLDAVEITPGRYAYRDGTTRRYYVVTGSQLERLGRYIEAQISQRASPSIAVPYGGGYSEWGADTVAFDMPAWWTPAIGLEVLAAQSQKRGQMAKREKAERLIRWVNKHHPNEPTTVLVARLKLSRDFDHCLMIDTIRYDSEESARNAALTLADEIVDTSVFDVGNETHVLYADFDARKKQP